MKRLFFLSFLFIGFWLIVPNAFSCGCGIAITDDMTFGNLNEPETFLVVDVHAMNNYDLVPFFRFVSLDEPYELKVVFPTKEIPAEVEGKKLSIKEFTDLYQIREAEGEMEKQSAKGVTNQLFLTYTVLLIPSSLFLNGIGLSFFLAIPATLLSMGTIGMSSSRVAHYEFEGGQLDIYDVSKADTLQDFVDSLGIEVGEKVKKVVEKYSDHYVAVMTLKVDTAINNADMERIKDLCPQGLDALKEQIKSGEVVTQGMYRQIVRERFNRCDPQSREFLVNILANIYSDDSDLEGIMVKMKFEDSSNFFYPISIVESYEYPITKQNYFVRVPENLALEINSSKVTQKSNLGGLRWYKVSEKDGDLDATIVKATFSDFIDDSKNKIFGFLYNYALIINVLLIILLLLIFFLKFVKGNKFSNTEWVVFVLGGLIITGLYFLIKKERRKLGISLLLFWLLLILVIPLAYYAVGLLL